MTTPKMTSLSGSERTAILVAHGSPSDPGSQEAALRALASQVQTHMSGWRIGSATLAAKGRFEDEIETLGAPLIYPYFMAKGWFTGQVLAKKARGLGLTMLEPFGGRARGWSIAPPPSCGRCWHSRAGSPRIPR